MCAFAAMQYTEHQTAEQIIKNLFDTVLTFLRVGTVAGLSAYEPLGTAWYISAMLLSMLIIYPIVRYRRGFYTYIMAPIVCVFIYGYLQHNYYGAAALDWVGICSTGLLRGLSSVSLGCVVYELSEKISRTKWTALGKKLLTILEIGGYLYALIHMQFLFAWGSNDFVAVMAVALSVAISGSGRSYTAEIPGDKTAILAELGMALYMGHPAIMILIRNSNRFADFQSRLIFYILFSFSMAFAVRWVGIRLKKALERCIKQLKNTLIEVS